MGRRCTELIDSFVSNLDVTVILLAGGLPSTSIAPLEIFACAGTLYHMIVGEAGTPYFRVRLATLDGNRTAHYVPVEVEPKVALLDIEHTDLVVVPTAGMDIREAVKQNSGVVEWLASRSDEGRLQIAELLGKPLT